MGAIFNLSLINQLKKDKIDLGEYKDNILSYLQNPQLAPSTKLSLQRAINISMKKHVYHIGNYKFSNLNYFI